VLDQHVNSKKSSLLSSFAEHRSIWIELLEYILFIWFICLLFDNCSILRILPLFSFSAFYLLLPTSLDGPVERGNVVVW